MGDIELQFPCHMSEMNNNDHCFVKEIVPVVQHCYHLIDEEWYQSTHYIRINAIYQRFMDTTSANVNR
jgi:hypothetical protein